MKNSSLKNNSNYIEKNLIIEDTETTSLAPTRQIIEYIFLKKSIIDVFFLKNYR